MRFLSVCSGIEAAGQAWEPLGWQCAGLSEIEPFTRAVLEQRHSAVAVDWDHRHDSGQNFTPLFGDFTQIKDYHVGPIELLVGGTPCQDFSIAGLRDGLDGERGNLTLEFSNLAYRTGARWLCWENVPGAFSTNEGRDFGAILATFSGRHGLVYERPASGWGNAGIVEQADANSFGLAWRVLDAQYFGVPQRRRRIILVGYLGDWRRAAAVLFERHSLQGHPAPSRETRPIAAALTANGVGTCGADDNQAQAGHLVSSTGQTAHCLNAGGMSRQDFETETMITQTLRAGGFDASEDGTGRGTPLVPVGLTIHGTDKTAKVASFTDTAGALRTKPPGSQENSSTTAVLAFAENSRAEVRLEGEDGQRT